MLEKRLGLFWGTTLLSFTVFAGDWTQWRGPGRDGLVSQVAEREIWRGEPEQIWRVEIGVGHSSPVTHGNRILTHSRIGDEEVVTCLSLEDGRILWQKRYPAPYQMNSAAYSHGKGPKSTPLIHQKKLYTLGISGILSSFALETGDLQWRHDFQGVYPNTSPLYGAAASPIAVGNRIVVPVGGHDKGALRAFDTQTGKTIWEWSGDGPGYASPVLVELNGTQQLVTQSQENIIGVSLDSGELLWRIPFSTPYSQNIVTPVVFNDTVILSGYQKGLFAVRLQKDGDGWSANPVWKTRDVSMYMSSPVLSRSFLFGQSHFRKGQLFCLDVRTGEVLWTGQPRHGENAALLVSAELLFALNVDAELLVFENTEKEFRKVAEHTLADQATWAHPIIHGSSILIKDKVSLTRWDFLQR